MKLAVKVLRIGAGIAVAVAVVVLVGRLVVSVVAAEPGLLGLNPEAERGGCPGTPNCVSTYAQTPEHAIEPLACAADPDPRVAAFADAIGTLPDVERLEDDHWVVYSRIFRFPDDVEIALSERGIEVFSASRLGAGDLGVNRKRVETIRDLLAADPRCG